MRALKGLVLWSYAGAVTWAQEAGDGLGQGQVVPLERRPTRRVPPPPLWSQCSTCTVLTDRWLLFCQGAEVAQELPLTSPVEDFRQPYYSSSGNLETPKKDSREGQSREVKAGRARPLWNRLHDGRRSPAMSWRTTGFRYWSISLEALQNPMVWWCCSLALGGWCNLILCQPGLETGFCYISLLSTLCNKDWRGGNKLIFKTLSMHPCKMTNLTSAVYFGASSHPRKFLTSVTILSFDIYF